jgi:hypothetical protein
MRGAFNSVSARPAHGTESATARAERPTARNSRPYDDDDR